MILNSICRTEILLLDEGINSMIIRRNSAFLLLFCIFLIGCGSIGDPAHSTATGSPQIEFTEADVEMTSPAARTLQINEVRVPAEGIDLAGTLYVPVDLPAPRPGVILLHMLRQDRSSWDAFARQLADAGYTALSVDLRGHGETGGVVDWDLAVADLQQAWQFLAGKDEINQDRTALIGASIGANLALIAAAEEASV
jgi:acetyl esterase/lipase